MISLAFLSLIGLGAPATEDAGRSGSEPQSASWSISGGGGLSGVDGSESDPQRYGTVGLRREAGVNFQRVGLSWVENPAAVRLNGPKRTVTVSITAGRQFGPLLLEGQAAYGTRRFDTVKAGPQGGLRASATGDSMLIGATGTLDLEVADVWLMSPFVTVEWAALDTTRRLERGDATLDRIDRQSGLTGTFGVTASRALTARTTVSVYGSVVVAENAAADGRLDDRDPSGQAFRASSDAVAETWGEIGLMAGVNTDQKTRLDIGLIRSVGLEPNGYTLLSATIRRSF